MEPPAIATKEDVMKYFKRLSLFAGFVLFLMSVGVRADEDDSVTLNSGEIVKGRITSQTDTDVTVEVSNERHTIFTTRTIARSDIKEVYKPSPEQRQANAAYEALGRYQLNPDQEFKSADYAEGIAAFDRFLAAYPNSEHATNITARQTEWRFEKFEVDHGRVKLGNNWMLPEAKKPLVEQQQLQSLGQTLPDQVRIVKAARARVAAAQKEHDFLHSTAGYKDKMLPQSEYNQAMARYAANDAEIPKANANLAAATAKFNELNNQYQKLGGTVNYQEQIDAKSHRIDQSGPWIYFLYKYEPVRITSSSLFRDKDGIFFLKSTSTPSGSPKYGIIRLSWRTAASYKLIGNKLVED
jgi:hypothetical protein